MLRAKKYLLSFLFVLSLGILQFNMVLGIRPALADKTLLDNQTLLTESAQSQFGGKAPQSVQVIVMTIIKTVLAFLAILCVIFLILAGFKYMTSAGDEKKIQEAMGQIKALVIGLVIILSAWGISYYVLKAAVCVTTAGSSTTVCPATFW